MTAFFLYESSHQYYYSIPWILKEISPGCSLEGLMLKLKIQHFGHLMRRVDSLEKILMLGGIGDRRRRGRQRMRWLDGITNSMTWIWVNSGSWWWTGRPGVLWHMGSQSLARLSDWTELNWILRVRCVYLLINCVNKMYATREVMTDTYFMTLMSCAFQGSLLLPDVVVLIPLENI